MPNRLKLLPAIWLTLLASCAASNNLPLISTPHVEPEPARVIVKTVPQPISGCGAIMQEYADFNRLNDTTKRKNIKRIKQDIKELGSECDTLRLALLHSTPGKLRQTDETIIELLEKLNLESDHFSAADRAVVLLMRNEINKRALVAKKIDRRTRTITELQTENGQLLQRLAELQAQLDNLKNLEENIAPE